MLDVRTGSEWTAGHVHGAVHVPLHELPARCGKLPQERLWVHCGSGYRASIAASLPGSTGRDVVLIDDDYANAARAGLHLTTGER